jgi:hypothetical protein
MIVVMRKGSDVNSSGCSDSSGGDESIGDSVCMFSLKLAVVSTNKSQKKKKERKRVICDNLLFDIPNSFPRREPPIPNKLTIRPCLNSSLHITAPTRITRRRRCSSHQTCMLR